MLSMASVSSLASCESSTSVSTRQCDASVVIRVDRLTEVNGVLELLLENRFTRVAWHLQQEETGVAFWKEVISRVVLVQHLQESGFKLAKLSVCVK